MRKVIFILSMIIMAFLVVFLFVAIVLHFNGTEGPLGISPSFRGYIARVISDTGRSDIMKIEYIPTMNVVKINNFLDFILNVGKVIVNLFIQPINLIVWLWNVVVTMFTFVINLVRLFIELKPEIFEVVDDGWWWRNLAIC